jgi:hypothetical protein
MVRAYNAAFGECCGVAVAPGVAAVLASSTFREISGCPASCDYVNPKFPSAEGPMPLLVGKRTGPGGACVPPEGAGRAVGPSFADAASPLCSDAWRALFDRYAAAYAAGGAAACSSEAIVAAAKLLAEDLKAAGGDPAAQAVAVRAFAVLGCSGNFNPLFTGNGYTATGFGGLFSPTVSEFITSPFDWDKLPSSAIRVIDMCVNGKNGGRPVDGKCAP